MSLTTRFRSKHRGTDAGEHLGLELVLATQYRERGFFQNVDRLAVAMDLDEMDVRQPRCGIPRGLNIAHLQRVGMKDADAIAEILRLTLRIEMDQRTWRRTKISPPAPLGTG